MREKGEEHILCARGERDAQPLPGTHSRVGNGDGHFATGDLKVTAPVWLSPFPSPHLQKGMPGPAAKLWRPAVITKCRGDGTYDVAYEDGEVNLQCRVLRRMACQVFKLYCTTVLCRSCCAFSVGSFVPL